MSRVDFYRVGRDGVAPVLFRIASRVLGEGGRLLVVAEDDALAAALDRALWEQEAGSFLPHARAGGADDADQPLLIAATCQSANGARNIALADGVWRADALGFDRAFLFFNGDGVDAARTAWREVKAAEGVEPHYWAQDDAGRWTEVA